MERKEAVEVIKKNWPDSSFTMLREALETLIPELAESEDEKIRKRIIHALHGDVLEMVEIKKAIAWLEKQGNLMKALQISNAKIGELIEKNYYLKEQLEKQGNNMGISEVTKQELEDNLNKALEKETPESCNEFLDEQGEQKTTIEMITPEESLGIDSDTYNKIVDECIYGEQKPAELPKGEDYGIDGLYAAIDILQKTLGEVDGYQSDDGILTHKCAISAVKGLSKQKPAWGEEDIELIDNTIKFIEDRVAATSPSLRTYSPTLTGKEIPFLKALKDRVQPKQEWSEEDNRMCKAIIDNIQAICGEGYFVGNIDSGELIEWLKSLRPQSQWKPSDEQMDALRYVTNFDYGGYKATLVSLYEQLKKLRGE